MKHACVLALLAGAIVSNHNPTSAPQQRSADTRPQEILWPQAPDSRRPPTPVGLLYTPEVLAALADAAPQLVSARIDGAIRQQTPIVVLWTIPPTADAKPWPRPFSTAIVDAGDDSFGGRGVRIEPLWVEQHADDLRQLDARTQFADVGLMAGYARSAFVQGRLVTIYRRLPGAPGQPTGVQRFGLIRWSGTTQ
jgi:hypothetical protein